MVNLAECWQHTWCSIWKRFGSFFFFLRIDAAFTYSYCCNNSHTSAFFFVCVYLIVYIWVFIFHRTEADQTVVHIIFLHFKYAALSFFLNPPFHSLWAWILILAHKFKEEAVRCVPTRLKLVVRTPWAAPEAFTSPWWGQPAAAHVLCRGETDSLHFSSASSWGRCRLVKMNVKYVW